MSKKNIIKVSLEKSQVLNRAYDEFDDFITDLSGKYNLNYYELFGLFECLKLNLNSELESFSSQE